MIKLVGIQVINEKKEQVFLSNQFLIKFCECQENKLKFTTKTNTKILN